MIRVFLRFCHRITTDLSGAAEMPQSYRLADVPGSITWDEVRRMLEAVDRRTALGRLILIVSHVALSKAYVLLTTPAPVQFEETRVAIAGRVGLPVLLPEPLLGKMWMHRTSAGNESLKL